MDDRLLTIKDVAGYLNVNERTVLKLVTDGTLPGVKVGNQWRFRKRTLDAWLDDQMLGVMPRYVESPLPAAEKRILLDFASCCQPDQVIPELAARSQTGVIEELATVANRLGLVRDKTWFVGALVERENAMPSAVVGGVAFLHTVRRNPEQVVRPFLLLGRSREGVPFGAPDSKPTHLFFLLGLKYEDLELPWLSRLSRMVAQPDAVKALLDAPDAEQLYQELSRADRNLG